MHFSFCYVLVLGFDYCYGQRKIMNGSPSKPRPYMVYLLKAQASPETYDSWMCGGALVSKSYIVTSAACIEDVKYLYAIAGYTKYVNSKNMYVDKCTSERKKKVVSTCVPERYDFTVEPSKWLSLDIAVAKVESPYDFTDQSYLDKCTHVPASIRVNYDNTNVQAGTKGLVMGWGHTQNFRKPGDHTDYNQRILLESSVSIADTSVCLNAWPDYLHEMITKFMICSKGSAVSTQGTHGIDERKENNTERLGSEYGEDDDDVGPGREQNNDKLDISKGHVDKDILLTLKRTNPNRPEIEKNNQILNNVIANQTKQYYKANKRKPIKAVLNENAKPGLPRYPVTTEPKGITNFSHNNNKNLNINIATNNNNSNALNNKTIKHEGLLRIPLGKNKYTAKGVKVYRRWGDFDCRRSEANYTHWNYCCMPMCCYCCYYPYNNTNPNTPQDTRSQTTVTTTKQPTTTTESKLSHASRPENGFCQNDHGGPLIGWVNDEEVLLGIQSGFLVDKDYRCVGPFLYSNTNAFAIFLQCVTKSDASGIVDDTLRLQNCEAEAMASGLKLQTRNVSWDNYRPTLF